ncbi:MAG: multiheme c-type cytochrome, partial [Hyphomicrobiaceae bacterium]
DRQVLVLLGATLGAGVASFALISSLNTSQKNASDGDAVAALRDYVTLHASLVRHPQARGEKTSKRANRDDAWATEVLVSGLRLSAQEPATGAAKSVDVAALGVPSADEKKKAGQTDDLLVPLDKIPGKAGRGVKTGRPSSDSTSSAKEDHLKLFVENRYPSAATCGVCHPKHYREWSVSQHAYAQLSPVYLSLGNRINQLSNGSNGDFCLRCHSPVGANLGESAFASNLDRHPTSREGITCVVCHRINKSYNKASGRLALVEGGLTEPVFGPKGNKGVKNVLSKPEKFRVVTDPKEPGRQIHTKAKVFEQIKTPVFCGTCHDVTLFNGFRLEEAYSEYRVSPAAAKGITCQDCHMGKIQGKPSGYERGPAALVGDQPTQARKLTSHLFSGPDYSVIHPGIFPHNTEAAAFKTMREWLMFRHKEGWGTDKFEENIPKGYKFPKAWESVDDRYDAREILNKQFKLLDFARIKRLEVLRNGFILGDVFTDRADENGLAFRVQVRNGTDGHNVPTGFTGERLVWLEVTVRDRDGTAVYRSGDRDPNGDLRDGHSSFVHAGKIKRDAELFSLQSIFVTQNGRGGEIEHVIPIPYPLFALPRVLPSTTSLVFTGEPATERNHKKGIEPNGVRWASYSVSSDKLTGKPPYKAQVRFLAQPVPVNLLIAMQKVGFDYGMTPKALATDLVAGTQVLWEKNIELDGVTATSAPASGLTTTPGQTTEKWSQGAFGRD